jgi:tetratricopeptide (TPR) repeat protein
VDTFIGSVVGDRYVIDREIGRGGMAVVWLARDRQHERLVAIKTLHAELAGAIGTDRFLREIRLTAKLQHPNIVSILDSGVVTLRDGTSAPWYAMPLLTGESLRARLNREQQLPIEESLRITEAVGRALEAAHEQDIVHRDIKPENVFLSGEQVYVVDFGIAKALAADADRLTSTGLSMGTPTYMSPEQAVAGTVDARSDQYSLATMLYEMLAGEPPFSGPNPQATLSRRLAEPARPLSTVRSTVPPAVEKSILRALERTPADRFQSVKAFLAALHAVDIPPPRAPTRRLQAGHVAIGVLLLAGVTLAISLAGARPKPTDPEVIALYQRGIIAYDKRTPAGIVEAVAALNNGIARDSSYSPAWNGLAKAYVRAYQRGFDVPDVKRERLLPLALGAVERALLLDSMSADAWTTHAIVSYQVSPTDVGPALRSIRRALSLDSSQAVTWHSFAIMQADSGDLSAGLTAWRRSVQLNPRYGQGLAFMALAHYWRGNYDSARVWADSVVSVDPNYVLGRQVAALIALEQERFDQARDNAEAAQRLSDGVETVNSAANGLLVQARSGQTSLVRAYLLAVEVSAGGFPPNPHTAVYLAEVHAALGDIDNALLALGRYEVTRDLHFQLHLRCSPTFGPLERDPRFRALLVIPRPLAGQTC